MSRGKHAAQRVEALEEEQRFHVGTGRERYRLERGFAVRVEPGLGDLGVLVEPASVLAKAWEHIERIGKRARWMKRSAASSPPFTSKLSIALNPSNSSRARA